MASGQGPGNTAPRPYSLSKDEAYARQLQEEENTATLQEDEEMARRMQRDLNILPPPGISRVRRMEDRPALRTVTPLTQLFSELVHHSIRHNQNNPRHASDSDEEADTDDSDSTLEDSSSPNVSPRQQPSRTQQSRGGRASVTSRRSSVHGMRPTETEVITPAPTPSVRRGTSRGRGRGRVTRRRGTVRGTTRRTTDSSENSQNVPRVMESSAPPLSLALNRPELPRGETEPEILILDRGANSQNAQNDDRFIHIMRDPILLIMFLMGRRPELLVPDDVDPNDYESLWELAERIGEVKNRGLEEKEMKTLPTRVYNSKTKIKAENQDDPGCRVCLSAYKTGDKLCTLPCKHEYHAACVKEWLKRNASCPICRHDIKPS